MPTKEHIDWPYVVLLVGLVVMIAAALHLLSTWVAYVIFAVLWIGLTTDDLREITPSASKPVLGGLLLHMPGTC